MRNRVALLVSIGLFVAAVVGAVVVAGGDGSTGTAADGLPKLPSSSASGARDSVAGARADMALYPYGGVEYRLAKPLDKPAETAAGYQVRTADRTAVEVLATDLGMRRVAEDPDGWVANGESGELRVDRRTGSWYFGPDPNTAVSSPTIGECAPCPPDRVCTMECKPVQKPAGMPTKDEAEAAARAFWKNIDVDVPSTLTVDENYDTWQVRFAPSHGGLPLFGLEYSVSVGPHKAIKSANGWLGDTDKLGDYPLISVDDAVKRLNNPPVTTAGTDGREPAIADDMPADAGAGGGSSGSSGQSSPGSAGSTEPAEPKTPITTHPGKPEPEPDPHPDAQPMPMPEPDPQPQTVTLTGVKLGLLFTGSHLVPAYLFTSESGDVYPVAAVTDEHLDAKPRSEVLID